MADEIPEVLIPSTTGELVGLRRRHPDALLMAGGTFLLSQRPGRFVDLPPVVISLQRVEELRRVSRSERFVDLGAALPIGRILRLAQNHVPAVLRDALAHVGPPAVAGLATLGGNLAVPGRLMTSVATLTLLDARVELRRQGRVRWMPVSRLHRPDGTLDLDSSEVISRIRVPRAAWSTEVFRRFGSELAPDSDPLTFCGLARKANGILEELRVAASNGGIALVREKQAEAELVGRRVPLADRDVRAALDVYEAVTRDLTPIQRHRLVRLVHWFLINL